MIVLSPQYMKLSLDDLQPAESEFELSAFPDKKFKIRKFTLRSRIWLAQRFGEDKVQTIFQTQSLPELTELVFYLMKDKTDIPTVEDFQEAIVTQKDRVSITKALLETLGVSSPVIDKLSKEYDAGNAQSPNPPIGANTTT